MFLNFLFCCYERWEDIIQLGCLQKQKIRKNKNTERCLELIRIIMNIRRLPDVNVLDVASRWSVWSGSTSSTLCCCFTSPHFPESKSLTNNNYLLLELNFQFSTDFIGRDGADSLTVGRLSKTENSLRMAIELGDFGERRIRPDGELVLREAVRRDELALVHRPLNGADLRIRVDRVDANATRRIPESQMSVSRAGTRDKQIRLPRAPCQCLFFFFFWCDLYRLIVCLLV